MKTSLEIILSEIHSQNWNLEKPNINLQLILRSVPGNCCVEPYRNGQSIKVGREL